jgi:hypothetical protein
MQASISKYFAALPSKPSASSGEPAQKGSPEVSSPKAPKVQLQPSKKATKPARSGRESKPQSSMALRKGLESAIGQGDVVVDMEDEAGDAPSPHKRPVDDVAETTPPAPLDVEERPTVKRKRRLVVEDDSANGDETSTPRKCSSEAGRDDGADETSSPPPQIHGGRVQLPEHALSLLKPDPKRHATLVKKIALLQDSRQARLDGVAAAEGGGASSNARSPYSTKWLLEMSPHELSRAKFLTPLEQQFAALRREYADAVLIVEVGYKYRFFAEDAQVTPRPLGVLLTERSRRKSSTSSPTSTTTSSPPPSPRFASTSTSGGTPPPPFVLFCV